MNKKTKSLLLKIFVIVFIIPGIPFVLGSIAILMYSNWPSSPGAYTHEPLQPNKTMLTVFAHGKGDNGRGWVAEMASLKRQQGNKGEQVIGVNWEAGAKDMFRCSRNGAVIGKSLANDVLAKNPNIQQVNFVAHSAGSFMAYHFCREIKKQNPLIKVETTYLDPVSIYRGLDWNYGVRHFGSCADVSRTYINVDDGVPGSNVALEHSETFDVSGLKPAEFKNGHVWPVQHYLNLLGQQSSDNKKAAE